MQYVDNDLYYLAGSMINCAVFTSEAKLCFEKHRPGCPFTYEDYNQRPHLRDEIDKYYIELPEDHDEYYDTVELEIERSILPDTVSHNIISLNECKQCIFIDMEILPSKNAFILKQIPKIPPKIILNIQPKPPKIILNIQPKSETDSIPPKIILNIQPKPETDSIPPKIILNIQPETNPKIILNIQPKTNFIPPKPKITLNIQSKPETNSIPPKPKIILNIQPKPKITLNIQTESESNSNQSEPKPNLIQSKSETDSNSDRPEPDPNFIQSEPAIDLIPMKYMKVRKMNFCLDRSTILDPNDVSLMYGRTMSCA
jgi:hypothetical protein